MRRAVLALLSCLAGCGYVSFRRPISQEEFVASAEIKAFYAQMAAAYAAGNPDALTSLYWPSITHPMTLEQIRQRSQAFFAEHGRARFQIVDRDIESLGLLKATVRLSYRVRTPDGKGGYSALERQELVRERGRWYLSAWGAVDPNEKRFDTILPLPKP